MRSNSSHFGILLHLLHLRTSPCSTHTRRSTSHLSLSGPAAAASSTCCDVTSVNPLSNLASPAAAIGATSPSRSPLATLRLLASLSRLLLHHTRRQQGSSRMVCLRPSSSLARWARRQGRRRGSGAGNRAVTVTGPDTACLACRPMNVPVAVVAFGRRCHCDEKNGVTQVVATAGAHGRALSRRSLQLAGVQLAVCSLQAAAAGGGGAWLGQSARTFHHVPCVGAIGGGRFRRHLAGCGPVTLSLTRDELWADEAHDDDNNQTNQLKIAPAPERGVRSTTYAGLTHNQCMPKGIMAHGLGHNVAGIDRQPATTLPNPLCAPAQPERFSRRPHRSPPISVDPPRKRTTGR